MHRNMPAWYPSGRRVDLRDRSHCGTDVRTCARASAGRAGFEAKRINGATTALANVTSAANPIPRAILQTAEAMLVFPYAEQGTRARGQGPNQVSGNATMGIRARGILSVRDDAGTWSPPAFVTLTGGGRHLGDLVFVIPNRKGVDRDPRPTVRARRRWCRSRRAVGAAATPDVTVLIYSQPRDWAAKTTFEGVMLSRDPTSNQNLYGKALNSREAIAQADRPTVAAWRAALKRHVR